MSIIVSSVVLVLLLCSSFNACNARSFGVIVHKETTKDQFQHSLSKKNHDDHKLNSARVSIEADHRKSSSPNGFIKDTAKDQESRIQKSIANDNESKIHNRVKGSSSGHSVSSQVSWRVPHNKRGDREPGFNFDYLPPKTHPPVHN